MTNMDGNKKMQVRAMFDSIAPRYDLLNHLLSFGIDRLWRKNTVQAVARYSPHRILDLATGTGDLAIAMARKMPEAEITGIDISAGMLAIGREKVEGKGLDKRVTLIEGDAQRLPFAGGEFDAVTAGFGIRNFADPEVGLREAFRVLGRGGRVYILEFSTPAGKVFGPVYRLYFHHILPIAGRIISKDRGAYTYLPRSVDQFPDNLLFLQMMDRCGFAQCASRRFMRGIAYLYEGTKK